jgi:hypothetical protein
MDEHGEPDLQDLVGQHRRRTDREHRVPLAPVPLDPGMEAWVRDQFDGEAPRVTVRLDLLHGSLTAVVENDQSQVTRMQSHGWREVLADEASDDEVRDDETGEDEVRDSGATDVPR